MPEVIFSPFSYHHNAGESIDCRHAHANKVCQILWVDCPFYGAHFSAQGQHPHGCVNIYSLIQKQAQLVALECSRMIRTRHSSRSIGTHIHYLPCHCTRTTDVSVNKQDDTLWHFDKKEGKIIHRQCGKVIFEIE
jgi:hypothetical protein